MQPSIATAITAEAHEVIRDRIVEILEAEMPNQSTLLGDDEVNAAIFKERVVPVGYEECPAVNVMLERVAYEGQTIKHTDSDCTYLIDIYTRGHGGETRRGDTSAAERVQKIARVTRGILEAPVYQTLSFPKPFISHRRMVNGVVSEPRDNKDANHMMMMRLSYNVKAGDINQLQDAREISSARSQMKLDETQKGHKIENEA